VISLAAGNLIMMLLKFPHTITNVRSSWAMTAVTLHSWDKVELELDSMVAIIAWSSPYKVLYEGMPNCHNGVDAIIVIYCSNYL